jgi:hypothetical protein
VQLTGALGEAEYTGEQPVETALASMTRFIRALVRHKPAGHLLRLTTPYLTRCKPVPTALKQEI